MRNVRRRHRLRRVVIRTDAYSLGRTPNRFGFFDSDRTNRIDGVMRRIAESPSKIPRSWKTEIHEGVLMVATASIRNALTNAWIKRRQLLDPFCCGAGSSTPSTDHWARLRFSSAQGLALNPRYTSRDRNASRIIYPPPSRGGSRRSSQRERRASVTLGRKKEEEGEISSGRNSPR